MSPPKGQRKRRRGSHLFIYSSGKMCTLWRIRWPPLQTVHDQPSGEVAEARVAGMAVGGRSLVNVGAQGGSNWSVDPSLESCLIR